MALPTLVPIKITPARHLIGQCARLDHEWPCQVKLYALKHARCLLTKRLGSTNNCITSLGPASILQLHSRHQTTIKCFNSSCLNVGINFKHLKAGSGKTMPGIPVWTGVKKK